MADFTSVPGSLIDASINRLLRETTAFEINAEAFSREQQDHKRLRQLNLLDTSGDTLVIVGFPTGDFVDCCGYKWETKEFYMDSKQLLDTGSAVFTRLLSPEAQIQTRRRTNRDAHSLKPATFILDLTPRDEGDDSAHLLIQLSLSAGVTDWWLSHDISGISKYLVSGHDENCPDHNHVPVSCFKILCVSGERPSSRDLSDLDYSELRKIPDYCPIRHRAAILRLLTAIAHGEVVLNSAPRVATMAVIAKSFGCEHVVRDSVLGWFMADPNQDFVDINTEDSLKIGWTLELPAITRVAFQILVVERAISILGNNRDSGINAPRLSIFGRPCGSVTEEQETCIQHAAQKLAQRVEDLWARLNSPDLTEYPSITRFLNIEEEPQTKALSGALRKYIGTIFTEAAIIDSSEDLSHIDRNRARYVPKLNRIPIKEIYDSLSPTQRILTPHFWNRLARLVNSRHLLDNQISSSTIIFGKETFGKHEISESYLAKLTFLQTTLENFHTEFSAAVDKLMHTWIFTDLEVNILLTGPLALCLSDEEFKFLPLWAGGLDDGTGAVYQSEIPDAERGFPIGPGPGFYTGETVADDDDDGYTADETATLATGATGAETATMTGGYSFRAAPSQITSAGCNAIEDAGLAPAAARLSTTPALGLAAVSVAEQNTIISTAPRDTVASANAADAFDVAWFSDASDDLDDLDNSDDSGSQSDEHANA
ncbi:hypothetical protein F5Y19DRAFT_469097 [Xylariaceae sp. FL1651]|nr:hypothetical protein F5Y19DRAFT_469097 [Xylariaceae sp. FL1651]